MEFQTQETNGNQSLCFVIISKRKI